MPTPDAVPIREVHARAYRIPTNRPEADGTLEWDRTVMILVQIHGGGCEGIGYSYSSRGCVAVIEDTLRDTVIGRDAFDIPVCWHGMRTAIRNLGSTGVAACALSAVDNALWDLKAKLLGLPLHRLLGQCRTSIAAYGSGGFTNENPSQVAKHVERWAKSGINRMKIKIGRNEAEDAARIAAAMDALPIGGQLFVDANGAYQPKQAVAQAEQFVVAGIRWFEEPVPHEDVAGMRFVRSHASATLAIAGGEYIYEADEARELLDGAVDVLQADATRCLGLSGFLRIAELAAVHHRPLSAHCAPSLHVAAMCHAETAVHCEYFTDHVRIEQLLFDGAATAREGQLVPSDAPGFGLTFKTADAEQFAA